MALNIQYSPFLRHSRLAVPDHGTIWHEVIRIDASTNYPRIWSTSLVFSEKGVNQELRCLHNSPSHGRKHYLFLTYADATGLLRRDTCFCARVGITSRAIASRSR